MSLDEIESTLKALRQPKWIDRRIESMRGLPQAKTYKVKRLIGTEKHSASGYRENLGRIERAAALFETLDESQRDKLWEGLFPAMATHLARAQKRANERPYKSGYTGMPFRAPHREQVVQISRARFFLSLCNSLRGLDPEPKWLAEWSAFLRDDWSDQGELSWVLSTTLDAGGPDADAVRNVLLGTISGGPDAGSIGSDTICTLLNSSTPSDWEVIGSLLLAAQRQEGLRQSIVESIHKANPGAFRYMLGLIREHELSRFSSVVRAFDVWLGFAWAGGSTKVVNAGVEQLCRYMDDDAARNDAIERCEANDAYLAMWVTALTDADQALRHAGAMINDTDVERRYAALQIVRHCALLPEFIDLPGARLINKAETDDRMLMAICELYGSHEMPESECVIEDTLFDAVGELFENTPKKRTQLAPIVWPWAVHAKEKRTVANALRMLAQGAPKKLLPYADALEPFYCAQLIRKIAGTPDAWDDWANGSSPNSKPNPKPRKLDPEEREFIVRMMVDTRKDVYEAAFRALRGTDVTDDEIALLTSKLQRTSSSFRRGAIERLSTLPGQRVLSVSTDLLDASHAKKRAAGLELANILAKDDQWKNQVIELVRTHRESFDGNEQLANTATRILESDAPVETLDEYLGLVPDGSRAPPIVPAHVGVGRETKAADACLRSLAELFLAHGQTEIQVVREHDWETHSDERRQIASYFPSPMRFHGQMSASTSTAALDEMPLLDIWREWVDGRDASVRDTDGMELVRIWAMAQADQRSFKRTLPKPFQAKNAWELLRSFRSLIDWLPHFVPHENSLAYLVQRAEDSIAAIDPKTHGSKEPKKGGKQLPKDLGLVSSFLWMHNQPRTEQATAYIARLGAVEMLAMDLGILGCESGPSLDTFLCAFDHGHVNEYDFAALLLKKRREQGRYAIGSSSYYGPIDEVTRLKTPPDLQSQPVLVATAHRVRDRLIDIELQRGEVASPATDACVKIQFAGGAGVLFRVVTALGKDKIVRQDQWGEPTRSYSLSRLISVTMPTIECTDEVFADLFRASTIPAARMLELAMFAPQWARHIERATKSPGLEEAVWWFHAHTKRRDDWQRVDIREIWTAQISERTELDAEDLEEGAVDVAWFKRMIDSIGPAQWETLQKPAKYASTSGGHKRAQLFADALLGNLTTSTLVDRIDTKRTQDAVRALGLVPLPKKTKDANAETLSRYVRLQEFRRQSRKFGSQRQASEGRAVEIGLHNLARTAGFRDPRRLEWSLEAEAVADLAKGPVTVTADPVSVTLAINVAGAPELTVVKNGKQLKSVPAKLAKLPEIAELRSRVTQLRRQASRMRLSLETSMCRGDVFTGTEIVQLCAHPMLRPMIERLVFVCDGKPRSALIGYPVKNGHVLRSHTGDVEPVSARDVLRVAHPADLQSRGGWHEWQRECLTAERVQPFKQVFRELYTRTAAERGKAEQSRRYAGHQVNPSQALALCKQRQWVVAPEEGVRKVFYDARLIAELSFQEHFYTPAEVDGLTLESVAFVRKGGDRQSLALSQVPDRIFSETMRDLDLVVSVAHAGGVDPEASASTVEMRSSLVKEIARLLQLENVRVDGHHVMIDGSLARYSVHLGSASTKVLPGRMLVIVAVQSQYRGRLFLPFADDDPKTAEVVAKTLLLARDETIKDPSILAQIRA